MKWLGKLNFDFPNFVRSTTFMLGWRRKNEYSGLHSIDYKKLGILDESRKTAGMALSVFEWSGLFLADLAYFFHQMASFGPLYNSAGVAVDFFGLRLCFNTLIANWPEDFLRKWTKYSLGE